MAFEGFHMKDRGAVAAGVDAAVWHNEHPLLQKVSARSAGNTNTDGNKNTSTNTDSSKNTVSSVNQDTVRNTVSVGNNIAIRDTATGALAGLSGLAGAGGRAGGEGRRGGGSACTPFSAGASAFIFGAHVNGSNSECVEHPEDLEFIGHTTEQAENLMERCTEQAKKAIKEGQTAEGQVDLNLANFCADQSKHLAEDSLAAAKRALDTRESKPTPEFSAELLNGASKPNQ